MKKAQIGGFTFEVDDKFNYIAFDSEGVIQLYKEKPSIYEDGDFGFYEDDSDNSIHIVSPRTYVSDHSGWKGSLQELK